MGIDEEILRLIEKDYIGDQATLRERLRNNGHNLTQPTLSRHLNRLNVRKEHGRYRHIERPSVEAPEMQLVPVAPNLVVLRTRPGYAQAIAVKLDSEKITGIAGTVAGDDTVIIVALGNDLEALCKRIRGALDYPDHSP